MYCSIDFTGGCLGKYFFSVLCEFDGLYVCICVHISYLLPMLGNITGATCPVLSLSIVSLDKKKCG